MTSLILIILRVIIIIIIIIYTNIYTNQINKRTKKISITLTCIVEIRAVLVVM